MKPKHRNIIHRHARLRSGAGSHKVADKHAAKKEDIHMDQISLIDFRSEHGIVSGSDMQDALAEWASDSVVPALCRHGCEVEPSGECSHGCPSILVRMGVV